MAKPGGAKKRPTGAKPRRGKPGAGMRKRQQQNRRQKLTGDKRKAPPGPVEKPESAALAGAGIGGASGDADDFGYLLDSMQDYKPPADSGDEGGDDAAADVAAGSGGSDGEAADAAAGGSKAAKPRRKRGQKLSSLEFEASRQMARQIGECSAEDQADWLWSSFQQHAAASGLERGGLAESGVAALPAQGSLEERLKGLAAAGGWQAAFCSREGPAGAPALLLVSPSAIGAVNLIKLCPQFNRACRIGKLFAKHFKVAEQEEALRSQVMCIAAGTPNRLCKLADGGALRLDRLAHVVLDVQLDVKQRDLLSIPETRADWWTFYERHLKQRVDAGSLKLSLVNSDRLA